MSRVDGLSELRAQFGAGVDYCERGDLFVATGISGVGPAGSPASPKSQIEGAYRNVKTMGDLMGFSLDEIGRITVLLPDRGHRPLLDPPWIELFPDAANRPARKTTHVPLGDGVDVELEVVGVRGAERTPVEIEGIRHAAPIPMGSRVGRHVFSSVIGADLPGGGRTTRVDAIEQTYRNLAAFMEAAGGSLADVSNVWVYLGMWDLHPEMVDTWVAQFPDETSRPTRKTYYYPHVDIQLQCEAVVGGGRKNFEIPGIGHHDPIPMGALTGDVFTSSGVDGRDPDTGKAPRGVTAQAEVTFDNLRRLLGQAEMTVDGLVQVTGLVGHRSYIPEFDRVFHLAFDGVPDRPAWRVMELGLPARDLLLQVIATGIRS